MITGIANQTNLLALNAAIRRLVPGSGKALRCSGKVRKLAEESGRAADSISANQRDTTGMQTTVEQIERSSQIYEQQDEAVRDTQQMFEQVDQGPLELGSYSSKLFENLASIDDVVRR